VAKGAAALSVNTPVSGWAVGDLIVIDTEAVTITAISGGSISFAPIVGQAHASSVPVIVSNLSRNAVVRSSGSSLSNSAYVEDLVTNATSFALMFGEFNTLGRNASCSFDCGVTLYGTSGEVKASISSSTFRNGYEGVYAYQASSNSFVSNIFYKNADAGLYVYRSTSSQIQSNVSMSNPNYGFILITALNLTP